MLFFAISAIFDDSKRTSMLRLQSTFPALALTLACGAFAQSTGT
ncbi:MAG: hypothetical protein ACI87O_002572, partial [Planctomycetota bacterium]